jgi:GMP synthase (glutamine-hydrolysing)
MSRLLIIKTGSAPEAIADEHGDFEQWFLDGLGLQASEAMVIDVQAGQRLPDSLGGLAGVLVTGSPAMVSHREPWSERAASWIAQAHRAALPMLGVCYGHQLIAHALGGRVGPNPAGRRMGTKRVEIRADDKDLLAGLNPVSDLHVTHLEAVLRVPAASRVIGETEGDPHHALHFGQRSWGVQFHPEFTAGIMASYIHLRSDLLRAEGQCPDSLLSELKDTPDGFRLLRRFADRLESSTESPAAATTL